MLYEKINILNQKRQGDFINFEKIPKNAITTDFIEKNDFIQAKSIYSKCELQKKNEKENTIFKKYIIQK